MALSVVARKPGAFVLVDTVANAPLKTFDFDADIAPLVGASVVDIVTVSFTYVTGAVGGARTIVVDILDAASTIVLRTPIVQTVTLSENWMISLTQRGDDIVATAAISGTRYASEILPSGLFLCSGLKISVGATAGGDATDDMNVYLHLRALSGNASWTQ